MTKPDPVQHMMAWGAIGSGLVLFSYFLLTGNIITPDFNPMTLVFVIAGIFTGYTLGGMSGVIIGTVFKHEQDGINSEQIHNRRYIVMGTVFIAVFLLSRLLIILAIGIVQHPLAISILGAIIASLASQHYLLRMEDWLKTQKPKRKNDQLPQRLLDNIDNTTKSEQHPDDQQTHHTNTKP